MKRIFFYALFPIVSIMGCEDLLRIDPPKTQIPTERVFTTNETANAAVLRLYYEFSAVNFGFYSTLAGNFSSDEFSMVLSGLEPFNDNSIPANNSTNFSRIWYPYYQTIYKANAIINGLAETLGTDEITKRSLTAEAKAIRAYCYFYLVNFFGEVPLLTSTDVHANLNLRRSEVAKVWQLIESDITSAVTDLPANYQSDERARINRSAGYALLARIKLYLRKWEEAEAAATVVINDPAYLLETDLKNVFLTTSRETIWQGWNETGTVPSSPFLLPASPNSTPSFTLSHSLLLAFTSVDLRRQDWIGSGIIGDTDFFYVNKQRKNSLTSTLPREYIILLRLAEQYLIRAEARTQQKKLIDAVRDLDAVRMRAGLVSIDNTEAQLTQEGLLFAIEEERLRELFAEGSHRWFDMTRTGRINIIMGSLKGDNWQSTAALFPIPQQEIFNNNNLTQNEGYE